MGTLDKSTIIGGGKYHCTAGLQFDKIGFDHERKYAVISM